MSGSGQYIDNSADCSSILIDYIDFNLIGHRLDWKLKKLVMEMKLNEEKVLEAESWYRNAFFPFLGMGPQNSKNNYWFSQS